MINLPHDNGRVDARPAAATRFTPPQPSTASDIHITVRDFEQLRARLSAPGAGINAFVRDALLRTLSRAVVCEIDAIPADAVTMNSLVVFRRHIDAAREERRLVHVEDYWKHWNSISIFTALGAALLGRHAGETVPYQLPSGKRQVLCIDEVPYQPERRGRAVRRSRIRVGAAIPGTAGSDAEESRT